MKRLSVICILLCMGLSMTEAQTRKKLHHSGSHVPVVSAIQMKTSRDSVSYALGIKIAQMLKSQGFGSIDLPIFDQALKKEMQGIQGNIDADKINQILESYHDKIQNAKATLALKEGAAFLAKNALKKGIKTLPDGLQYEILVEGPDTAAIPTAKNVVKCHYIGKLLNGKIFDSSVERGEAATFSVNEVIKGWQEVLQMMHVGSKWRVYIPANLAYGNSETGPIPAGSTLIFDIQLLGIEN